MDAILAWNLTLVAGAVVLVAAVIGLVVWLRRRGRRTAS